MADVKLVCGRWVITGESVLEHGAVAVDGQRIVEVGVASELRPKYTGAEIIGSDRSAVLPGFVNAHHHSHGISTIQNGHPDRLLESWLLDFAGVRDGRNYEDTLLSAANQLRGGVTSLVDVGGGGHSAAGYQAEADAALRAYETAGIRVALACSITTQGFLVHGEGQDDAFVASLPDALKADARALLPEPGGITDAQYLDIVAERAGRYADHPLIDVWFAPSAPHWVSDGLMQSIAKRAEAVGTQVQTHCNESLYEKLHGNRFYGCPTVEHLDKLEVLSPRFSIAHGVWLTESEIQVLARTGAAVSHNPSSNLRLRAGIAPLNALLDAGVSVALGMDGTTINDDEDMFSELRLALRLNHVPHYGSAAPTVEQLFRLATQGGAALMGKQDQIGRLAPGYLADLMLVDLERIVYPWVAPEVDPLELILLRAHKHDVRVVMVNGEVVMRDGVVLGFDEHAAADALSVHLDGQALPSEYKAIAERIRPHMEAWYSAWGTPSTEPYTQYNAR